jgi:bifunctional non-homologous end joining protein LigD
MRLEEFRAERNFHNTAEPTGGAPSHQPLPIFVVQEHHASHLHWDFRLEADGVLKSWAVPKGPSLDPTVRRLAVEVEDHPLGYAAFEGTIPKGQYGGGTVKIWDHGTYEGMTGGRPVTEAIGAGRLEFLMHGGRLRGVFTLVRMKPKGKGMPQWLLIKKNDEFAVAHGE